MKKNISTILSTKPAGQGTGLGLSLSYNIVKAHGGELKVETKEGEEVSLFFSYLLPESRLPAGRQGLIGLKDYMDE